MFPASMSPHEILRRTFLLLFSRNHPTNIINWGGGVKISLCTFMYSHRKYEGENIKFGRVFVSPILPYLQWKKCQLSSSLFPMTAGSPSIIRIFCTPLATRCVVSEFINSTKNFINETSKGAVPRPLNWLFLYRLTAH